MSALVQIARRGPLRIFIVCLYVLAAQPAACNSPPAPLHHRATYAQPAQIAQLSAPCYTASSWPRACAVGRLGGTGGAAWARSPKVAQPVPSRAVPHLDTGSTCTAQKSNLAELACQVHLRRRNGEVLRYYGAGAAPAGRNRPRRDYEASSRGAWWTRCGGVVEGGRSHRVKERWARWWRRIFEARCGCSAAKLNS